MAKKANAIEAKPGNSANTSELPNNTKSPLRSAKGLGRGLDVLIPSSSKVMQHGSNAGEDGEDANKYDMMVDINRIEPNREQPRKEFNEDALEELAESIKHYGVIQPLLVKDRGSYYQIVAGERRWRASRIAGLTEVPVIVRDLTEQEIVEISLIENIQREDLNPIEEAIAYKRLMNEFSLKQDEIAERVSKSRTTITNSIRLLKLCEEVQKMVIDEMITTGHARTIISVDNPEEQYNLALRIFDEKMSVREAEKIVKNRNKTPKKKKEAQQAIKLIYEKNEENLKQILGRKVTISAKGDSGAGKIELEFYDHDDFERIIEVLKVKKQN